MYLVKTNSNGDTLWTKKFGGTNDEAAYEVHQTLDNGYILAGYTTSFGAGNSDFYLVKTNSNGDTLWTKTYGGTADDSCTSVALCKDKGFLLGGSTQSNRTQKIYFLRTDSVGNVKDSNAVSPVGKGNNYISRIRETKDLNYITLVNSGMGILLYKWTRGTGFGSWSSWGQSFGLVNDQAGYDLQQTSDSGFVLVGYTASIGIGPDNIFIAKTNKLGDYNDTANSYVAVNEISEKDTSALIYPNPFSENLFLKIHNSFFADEKEFSFEVSDICGRGIMKTTKNVSPSFSEPIEIQIPSEKFKPGFYLASLQSGNKKIYRKLLFVK
jgi:hypothetical protein